MPSPAINVAGITFSAANCTFGTPFYGHSVLLFQLNRRLFDLLP
jgi:hypothetical protein